MMCAGQSNQAGEDNVVPFVENSLVLRENVAGEWEIINAHLELPGEVQQRMEAIQKLLAVQGTERYGRVQQQVAQRLGISVRSVQRLLKKWREQGIASLPRQKRSDRGAAKTSREWQEFIHKTYQVGNRGSRKMSRAQVYLRVQAQAEANGVKEYPSRPTVYRILRPLLEQQQQQKRTLGWRGEQLKVNSREGLEIGIEWSNQVWQVDHTQIPHFSQTDLRS